MEISSPPNSLASFRSGYVAIVGWPNTGKSTLLNALLKFKLSIVSPKPQTTRDSVLGILNEEGMQMVFVDTPGWLKPQSAFQNIMKKAIVRSIFDDADAILWVVEPRAFTVDEKTFVETLKTSGKPVVVAINKIDTILGKPAIQSIHESIKADLPPPFASLIISAKAKQGLNELKMAFKNLLPIGEPYFPTDQITDRWERFFVAELIREQIFTMFRDEVPHSVAVMVDDFIEADGRKDVIRVSLYVETAGQKQILVGNQGRSIRDLGQKARTEIEAQLGRPVFLEMVVKIKKKWRDDLQFVKQLSGEA